MAVPGQFGSGRMVCRTLRLLPTAAGSTEQKEGQMRIVWQVPDPAGLLSAKYVWDR